MLNKTEKHLEKIWNIQKFGWNFLLKVSIRKRNEYMNKRYI